MGLEYLQGWRLHSRSQQPVPLFDRSHSKKAFLRLNGISVFKTVCVASCPFNGCHSEESGCTFSVLSHHVFIHIDKIPLNLLFSRLNGPSSFSLSLYVRCCSPLSHPYGPSLGSLLEVRIFLVSRSPELDQALQMCLTSPEERRIISLYLLATLLLMQPRMLLVLHAARVHCGLQLGARQDQQVFLCQAAFQPVSPSTYGYMGLFLPRCRTCHFPLLMLTSCLPACFSSLSRSLWMAAQAPGVSAANLLRVPSAPSSSSLIKTLSSTGPCGKPLVTGLQLVFERSGSARYQSTLPSAYLVCSSSVCL